MGNITTNKADSELNSSITEAKDISFGSPVVISGIIDYDEAMFPIPEYWVSHYDVVYAFDVETQAVKDSHSGTTDNVILSYQLAIFDVKRRLYTERILFPDHKRYSLSEILSSVCLSLGYTRTTAKGLRILQLAHYGSMEWASLSDRKEMPGLNLIHSVPVCRNQSVSVPFAQKHAAKVRYSILDTSLHAPAGFMALNALSAMTHVKKLSIGNNIQNMASFLATDKGSFIHYAINDVRVTIEYEARFLAAVQEIIGHPCQPSTLGAMAVFAMDAVLRRKQAGAVDDEKCDIKSNPLMLKLLGKEIDEYKDKHGHIKKRINDTAASRVNRSFCSASYLGGLNAGFCWSKEQCDVNSIIVDLDLCSAYPSSIAAFNDIDLFSSPKCGGLHYPVRSVAQLTKALKKKLTDAPLHGYFQISFKWDNDVLYPSLPCSVETAGLVYPLEGMTFCTASELISALSTGRCEIKVMQYVIFEDMPNQSHNMADVFAYLTKERRKHPKGSLLNKLYKECANSLYGKLAQGVRTRKIYDVRSGGTKDLPESPITCPYIAADCTGLIRASLSTLIATVADYPGCRIISVTTDGAMVVVPRPKNLKITTDDNGIVDVAGISVKDVLPTGLIQKLEAAYAIRMFMRGPQRMNFETWIEPKHIGDEFGSYRTRANWIKYNGVLQYKAAAGMQVSSADEMDAVAESDTISQLPSRHLASVRDIIAGKATDVVDIIKLQHAALSPDGKRIVSADGKSSKPPVTINDATKIRAIVKNRRRQNLTTTPAMIIMTTALNNKTRIPRGANEAHMCRKLVIRAIAHGTRAWKIYGMTKAEIAKRLGLKDLKNQSRQQVILNSIPKTPASMDAMEDICQKLDVKLTQDKIDEMMIKEPEQPISGCPISTAA